MMRSSGIVALSLVLALGMAATAQADTQVWFTSNSPLVTQSGPGQTLILTKPNQDPARHEVEITMWLDPSGSAPGNLTGYSWDLYDFGDPRVSVKANPPLTYTGGNGAFGGWLTTDPPVLNTPNRVIQGAGQVLFFPGSPFFETPIVAPQPVLNFTLSWAKGTDFADINLYSAVGFNFFAPAQLVSFGPNAGVANNDTSAPVPGTTLPSIQIVNIPEPATIAMLGLGVLGLVRRRR